MTDRINYVWHWATVGESVRLPLMTCEPLSLWCTHDLRAPQPAVHSWPVNPRPKCAGQQQDLQYDKPRRVLAYEGPGSVWRRGSKNGTTLPIPPATNDTAREA
jgi:hypothetical protein